MILKIIGIAFPIFLIVMVGFVYGRRVKPDLSGANKLVIDIALPVLIFTSLAVKSFEPASVLWFTAASSALILMSGLLAWPLVRFSGAAKEAFVPCVMFTNVGPIGIPLIALAYGPQGLPLSIVLLVISNLLHFTVGAAIMSGRVDWRMVYANPLVWSTVLGLCASQWQLELPAVLQTPLSMLGNVLIPMMLMSLGVRLANSQVNDAQVGVRASLLSACIRLCAVYLLLECIPLQGVERGALILSACLPPAVFNFMLADKLQVEPNKVASTVIIGHFFSLGLLPLGLWLAFA